MCLCAVHMCLLCVCMSFGIMQMCVCVVCVNGSVFNHLELFVIKIMKTQVVLKLTEKYIFLL